jgi:Tol biopolymer transport system component
MPACLLIAALAAAADTTVPSIFAPGVISGPAHDAAPAFSPDGSVVYFSRNNSSVSLILMSRRTASGWTDPEVASFSGEWSDLEPAMAPDGSYLIFVSNRPASPGGSVGSGRPPRESLGHPGL